MRKPTARSRERAALLAGLTLLATGLSACGREQTSEPAPAPAIEQKEEIPGLWRKLRPQRVDPSLSEEQRERIAQLEAIGYLSGSVKASALAGVTLHDRERAYRGLNFYTSGHAPEAVLMDMDGNVLHRWRYNFLDLWPDYPKGWMNAGAGFWRRAHLYENGDILAIFEGLGIIKLDKDSNLLWASPVRAHHDLHVTPEGEIYVLSRKGHLIPRIDPEEPVLEDFISILDAEGREKKRISVLESLESSEFRDLWNTGRTKFGDIFHTNTIELLDGSIAHELPAFAAGNVLTSLLVPDMIAVVDLEQEKVVWALKGSFKKQHDPKILASGRLLLFDNRGPSPPFSRVLEFDPAHPDTITWEYRGSKENPFSSFNCGAAERLPNGNTLITESDNGRAFEVTPEKETVWEFYNPHRAGDDHELIATLFELVRLPPDFPTAWVHGAEAAEAPAPDQGSTFDR
jgi:hypothetical protein